MKFCCPWCGQLFTERIPAQLHFAMCSRKPILRKLSIEDRQRLLARAREIDMQAGREARTNG